MKYYEYAICYEYAILACVIELNFSLLAVY